MKNLLLAVLAFLLSVNLAWAVDANTATQAELETVRGIGPSIAARIVEERRKGPYKDLADLEARVKGVGETSIRKMAESGLTVGPGTRRASTRSDAKKSDAPKDVPRADARKAEPAKAEPAKAAPKSDARKSDSAKDAPKGDAPKGDAAKTGTRAEARKAEPAKDTPKK